VKSSPREDAVLNLRRRHGTAQPVVMARGSWETACEPVPGSGLSKEPERVGDGDVNYDGPNDGVPVCC